MTFFRCDHCNKAKKARFTGTYHVIPSGWWRGRLRGVRIAPLVACSDDCKVALARQKHKDGFDIAWNVVHPMTKHERYHRKGKSV